MNGSYCLVVTNELHIEQFQDWEEISLEAIRIANSVSGNVELLLI